jgi:hypothetical protein
MVRPLLRLVIGCFVLSAAAPVLAADKPELVAPSAAVAAEWAKEGQHQQPPSSAAVKALYASYGALQTLDMTSTIAARNRGAREANPMMNGGYGQAAAMKIALSAVTIAAVKQIEKKNRKAAMVTMVAINAATAAVVVNNYKNARALGQR